MLACRLTKYVRFYSAMLCSLQSAVMLYVKSRDCNPGTIFQSRDFGIEKRQSRDPGIGNYSNRL